MPCRRQHTPLQPHSAAAPGHPPPYRSHSASAPLSGPARVRSLHFDQTEMAGRAHFSVSQLKDQIWKPTIPFAIFVLSYISGGGGYLEKMLNGGMTWSMSAKPHHDSCASRPSPARRRHAMLLCFRALHCSGFQTTSTVNKVRLCTTYEINQGEETSCRKTFTRHSCKIHLGEFLPLGVYTWFTSLVTNFDFLAGNPGK